MNTAQTKDINGYQYPRDINDKFVIATATAISRKDLTAPLKLLIKKNIIDDRFDKSVLHFGKGKAIPDCDYLKSKASSYAELDVGTANASEILGCNYKDVICNYVLNVLEPTNRHIVWTQLAHTTDYESGRAFIAVRSYKDKGIVGKPFKDGVLTARTRKILDANGHYVEGQTFQKGYLPDELRNEALQYFNHAEYICSTGSFHIVMCSHQDKETPLEQSSLF